MFDSLFTLPARSLNFQYVKNEVVEKVEKYSLKMISLTIELPLLTQLN